MVTVVDDLRLDTLLRMLKTPHFSTKMNSLKEVSRVKNHACLVVPPYDTPPPPPDVVLQVTKLIEESTVAKTVKNAIDTDKLLDWLVENSVLSIALEGKKCDQQELAPRLRTVVQTNKIEYRCGMIRVCH